MVSRWECQMNFTHTWQSMIDVEMTIKDALEVFFEVS